MNTILNFIGDIISIPFGYVLSFFYNCTNNYIIALILLTIVVKLCLLPISVNQRKNTLKNTILKTEINKIKKTYANNEEKVKQETEIIKKKYAGKNIGCLTSLLQFFILIGVFRTICTPLTSILRFNDETIEAIRQLINETTEKISASSNLMELNIIQEFSEYKEVLLSKGILSATNITEITSFIDKFKLCSIDLSVKPQLTEITNLIPLFVLITSMASVIYTYIRQRKANPARHKGKYAILDATRFVSPAMMYLFAFMFPAGIGLYWIISSTLSFVQRIVLNNIYTLDKMKKKIQEGNTNG